MKNKRYKYAALTFRRLRSYIQSSTFDNRKLIRVLFSKAAAPFFYILLFHIYLLIVHGRPLSSYPWNTCKYIMYTYVHLARSRVKPVFIASWRARQILMYKYLPSPSNIYRSKGLTTRSNCEATEVARGILTRVSKHRDSHYPPSATATDGTVRAACRRYLRKSCYASTKSIYRCFRMRATSARWRNWTIYPANGGHRKRPSSSATIMPSSV